jgi:putative transposase
MKTPSKPSIELRLSILSAVEHAEGKNIRERIKNTAKRTFVDHNTQEQHQFTWRTISTWLYRYKKNGVISMDNKTRCDKNTFRKIQPNELAEAIKEILPTLRRNKTNKFVKSTLYRQLLRKNLITRKQLAPTTFYRIIREHDLLDQETTQQLRLSFAMQYANELWQADTMYGPSIKQPNGSWKKTFLIAFIDDASRVITHGEFFYRDNTENMIEAFKSALFKRGKPDRLYFDNGSNYKSKEILQACLRLDIHLSHAPVRDGAAKGKIERFFRGFRDRFLTRHIEFKSLEELNDKTTDWIENEYNNQHHTGIQMKPVDRFNLDLTRIQFIANDEYSDENFFIEEDRTVNKTNVFPINTQRYECPVDLRSKVIQVRYDRNKRDRFIVYFNGTRMGKAHLLNQQQNAKQIRHLISGGKSS